MTFSLVLTTGHGRSRQDGKLYVSTRTLSVTRNGVRLRLPATTRRFLTALAARPGAIVSLKELVEAMYGERADGGPDDIQHMLSVIAHESTLVCVALRLRLRTHRGRGWSIEPIEPPVEAPSEEECYGAMVYYARRVLP